eukprot:Em0001g2406a
MIGKPAAFDLTVVSPLNSTTLNEVGARSGSAAGMAEVCKHNANDAKCTELGWVCISLAVETYGCWGVEVQGSISRLAAHLALQLQCSKSKAITSIYQRLNLTLVHCNARALLSRARFQHSVSGLAAGQAARATEQRKHDENDAKCKELGWICVPMVVEAYRAWGTEAMESFSLLGLSPCN